MTIDVGKPLILIGAGGHAKSVWEALESQHIKLQAYVDPKPAAWLEKLGVKAMDEQALAITLPQKPQLIMGFLGLTPEALKKRLSIMRDYAKKGASFPAIVHRAAIVSNYAIIEDGVQILAGGIVNGHAKLSQGSVVNTRAVVEHDATIGAGSHVAPGAVVLGGATTGECAYIGSNAVVLANGNVAADTLIKVLTHHT